MTDSTATLLAGFILAGAVIWVIVSAFFHYLVLTFPVVRRLLAFGLDEPPQPLESQSTNLDGNPPGAERPEGRQHARHLLE